MKSQHLLHMEQYKKSHTKIINLLKYQLQHIQQYFEYIKKHEEKIDDNSNPSKKKKHSNKIENRIKF